MHPVQRTFRFRKCYANAVLNDKHLTMATTHPEWCPEYRALLLPWQRYYKGSTFIWPASWNSRLFVNVLVYNSWIVGLVIDQCYYNNHKNCPTVIIRPKPLQTECAAHVIIDVRCCPPPASLISWQGWENRIQGKGMCTCYTSPILHFRKLLTAGV